ncbi:hypothetical protein ME0899_18050 [Lactobacillus delbrueckii subsp. bulgaricus]|nr:hypothetical protein ME0899_18050 [Lactobacillus delbrueckii subsp. bulgaricus]
MDVKKIQDAIAWMKQGGLVIVADDEDRGSRRGHDWFGQQGYSGKNQLHDQACPGPALNQYWPGDRGKAGTAADVAGKHGPVWDGLYCQR